MLRLHEHPQIQLTKAKTAFQRHSRLFLDKNINHKAKIILYSLLIRPIMTYAAPIWFNQSAHMIEKLRQFERACLRICLSQHRSKKSNFKKYISNKSLYNRANLTRIDNHMIKLARGYYANAKHINNTIIKQELIKLDTQGTNNNKKTGLLPPEAFMVLYNHGLIQNSNNIPIIYHWARHAKNKSILIDPEDKSNFKYSQSIPQVDYLDFSRINNNYWWIAKDSKLMEELRKRAKYKKTVK